MNEFEVHDVDEDGVPEDRGYHWGEFRVEQLLYRAKRHNKENKSSVICGIAFPHDVVDGRYYESGLNIHYVLLVCSRPTMKKRLQDRLIAQGKRSGWMKLTDLNVRVSNKLRKQTESKRNHFIIDTGKNDESVVIEMIMGYVNENCSC